MKQQMHAELILPAVAACLLSVAPQAALADFGAGIPSPYDRLNLSPVQAQHIRDYESDWRNRYSQLQPRMMDLQQHLNAMLNAPKADPIEITTTQQRINQIREQLGVYATSTYLHKRQILTDPQRAQLDGWMRHMLISRQREHL